MTIGTWVKQGKRDAGDGDCGLTSAERKVLSTKMRPLPLWTAVTTIIYNLAVAAVNSF